MFNGGIFFIAFKTIAKAKESKVQLIISQN